MSNKKHHGKYCEYNDFKRTRYFHGMLMTDRDFREEQIYHNEKRRLLNRMLHGWGVVSGFDIEWKKGESVLTIKHGMALDCHGNEILVCDPVAIDTSSLCLSQEPPRGTDAYCQYEAERKNQESPVYYIGIRYHEVPTDPVAVYAPTGGCDERACEYSRIREGFCIKIFHHLPYQPPDQAVTPSWASIKRKEGREGEEAMKQFTNSFCQKPLPCPDCCPEEHYIVLGTFKFDENTKAVAGVDLNDGRRYVLTSRLYQYVYFSLKGNINPKEEVLFTNPFQFVCADKAILERKYQGDAGFAFANIPPFSRSDIESEVMKLREEIESLKEALNAKKGGS